MDAYSIYWIKEEVAAHYFHKSNLLYHFFKDYRNDLSNDILKKQFNYITRSFPESRLISHIKNYYNNAFMLQFNGSQLIIHQKKTYISLHMDEKQLKFRCNSLQDAEEILFPMLRSFHSNLFITGRNVNNFGWISPIITSNHGNQSEQVLYSFL
ncbi:sporulation inhibitor of replication protein SirA [Virgibacillus sp. SK37]|uniref:sporulation inhibitor of replication protein SirA n=1 Tax=Virgibacillus sp. SK37 TaxID=403957 RepID=UPI0004D1FBE2|nr:sporulation inhibitor of replication protein SirA [Virgibacillus sp. SK37]AIF45456.1 hypothetical protein X953_11435 [Virgibacillus sp. SK37]